MAFIDVTKFDFSGKTQPSGPSREAVVRNDAETAVLHVVLHSPVPWVDVYPLEFALAPLSAQKITVRLAPERSREALIPVSIGLHGQYLHVNALEVGALPANVSMHLALEPPDANCPTCGSALPSGVRECRRCGERIRPCPNCGAPNSWTVHTCRVDSSHVIRPMADWLASPGGDSRHGGCSRDTAGISLSRRWSLPSFAPTRTAGAYEWCAPLAAFGMLLSSAINSAGSRSVVAAYEIDNGGALWECELPDPRGIYPDRGAPALSADGGLYLASLGGYITAIDAIRGTLQWSVQQEGAAYGGLVVAGDLLLAPMGSCLRQLDRRTGTVVRSHEFEGRLDSAPGADDSRAYVAADNGVVTAIALTDGSVAWSITVDGGFDAAPVLRDGIIYVATMAGWVYALDTATGGIQWQTRTTAKPIAVAPALSADGLLYVAADDGFIHIVDARAGKMVRSRRVAQAPLRCSPVCIGSNVFVGADDGNIYALDAEYNVHIAYETTPGARVACAGIAVYGDILAFAATNGVLYVLTATG